MHNFKQCLNLFNVTFGQLLLRIGATKMFRYRLIGTRRVILSNAENDSNSDRHATLIFDKMAAVGHFGCPKFTLDHISGHFRSIQIFFCIFFYKMADVGHFGCPNLLSIAFLAISDRYATLICFWNFWQNGWRRPFWMSEIHFRSHFWHFRSIGHFGFPKFTFDRNSGHFRSIHFFSSGHFGCLKITLDRISGHFRLIGHFWCPKFTFDGISAHFRSIRNFIFYFYFLTKWPLAAILDVRK